MQFLHATRLGFLNYVNFRDRSSRSSYWYWTLFTLIVNLATVRSDALSTMASIVLILPSISVAIRRMHDTNRSGWWMLVPIYNIVLACQPGDAGENRFGPPEPPLSVD